MNIPKIMTIAVSCLLIGGVAVQADESGKARQRVDKQMGAGGNAMGVPEPGSVSDMESTEKKPDVSKIQSSRDTPRLPYMVEGEILSIDGKNYEISSGGDRVKLIVNRDTNFDCSRASASGDQQQGTMKTDRLSAKEQAPEASDQQLAQGQRKNETARGSGFQIGSCNFKQGDRVKAEVDDNGRVTTLKYLAASDPQSERSGLSHR